MSEAFYGIALCFLKLNNYKIAVENIEFGTKLAKTNLKYYKYLKAVCHKQLEQFELANELYTEVSNIKKVEESNINYLLYGECYVPNDGWRIDKKVKIISILEEQRFFNRFNIDDIEIIFKFIELKIGKVNTLLFLKSNEVAVLLQGTITIYSHIDDVERAKVVASYGAGSVIGYAIDNGISRHPEHWNHITENIEVCIFSKEDFDVNKI